MKPFDFTTYLQHKIKPTVLNRAIFITRNSEQVSKILQSVPTKSTEYEIKICACFIIQNYKNAMPVYLRWRKVFGPMAAMNFARNIAPNWKDPVNEFWDARMEYAKQIYGDYAVNTK